MPQIVDGLRQHAKFGLRLLTRDRVFAATAILLLGLGIGVNNMMFTVIYGHTLRKLPIFDPDRVLYVSALDDRVPDQPLSYPELEDLRQARNFTAFTAYSNASVTLSERARAPERVDATYVTSNGFELISRAPVLGRMITLEEDTVDAAPVALLGSTLWRARQAARAKSPSGYRLARLAGASRVSF